MSIKAILLSAAVALSASVSTASNKKCDHSSARTAVMIDSVSRLQAMSKNCALKMNEELLLHTAAKFDSVNAAAWLMDRGAMVEMMNDYNQTPLHFARTIEMAKLLLSRGAQTGDVDRWNQTPFQMMLEYKDWALLNFMLENGSIIRHYDLNWASDYYHFDTLNYLADRVTKTSILGKGRFFRTFFFYEDDYQKLAEKLVSKGADIDAAKSIRTHRTPLVLYVDEYVRNEQGFQKHGFKAIDFIVSMGADVNQFSKNGQRPVFHFALMRQDLQSNIYLMDLFLENGLDLNWRSPDVEGKTALMQLASRTGTNEGREDYEARMMEELLERGANANIQARNGRTALHYAVRWAHAPAANVLLKHANASIRDNQGRTALEYAFERLDQAPSDLEKRALARIIRMMEKR